MTVIQVHGTDFGQAYGTRWSRPDPNGGTRFTTEFGQPVTFVRGPVWIVLAARGRW